MGQKTVKLPVPKSNLIAEIDFYSEAPDFTKGPLRFVSELISELIAADSRETTEKTTRDAKAAKLLKWFEGVELISIYNPDTKTRVRIYQNAPKYDHEIIDKELGSANHDLLTSATTTELVFELHIPFIVGKSSIGQITSDIEQSVARFGGYIKADEGKLPYKKVANLNFQLLVNLCENRGVPAPKQGIIDTRAVRVYKGSKTRPSVD